MSDALKKSIEAMMRSASSRLEADLRQSLFMQDMPARRFRVDAVVRLSVEYQAAADRCIFSAALARQAIEYVMLGDWKEARRSAGYMRFLDEPPERREGLAKNWEVFVAMTDAVCDEAKRIEAGGEHHRRGN